MNSTEEILRGSRSYSLYVCQSRAIPKIQDGLKTVQRVALYLLRNRREKIKTVALGGLMAAEKLYVHGDVSANDAISKLCGEYRNNYPLIKGHGQFGSRITPDKFGAPRYTEVQRSSYAESFLYNDSDIVPMTPNYDGSNQEPVHFLPIIPTILLNGIEGVAVAYSTSILPRSLKGVIQATEDVLNNRKEIRGLEPFFERYNISIENIGSNQYRFSGKVKIEDASTLRVTELPPGLSKENFLSRLIQMEEEQTIINFVDRSAATINIVVKFKRGTLKDWTEDRAIDFLKLREKRTERIVVVDWNGTSIRVIDDAVDLVKEFVAWRIEWYRKRFQKLIEDTNIELEYLQLLKILFEGGFTKKLGTFSDQAAMESEMKRLAKKASDDSISRAMHLPTYRWTKDFFDEVVRKIKNNQDDIKKFTSTLNSDKAIRDVYLNEISILKNMK